MYFQLVEKQVLSTQGQPDGGVNLHRLTEGAHNSFWKVGEVCQGLLRLRVSLCQVRGGALVAEYALEEQSGQRHRKGFRGVGAAQASKKRRRAQIESKV